MQPKRTKVLRKGAITEINEKDMQRGDISFGFQETDIHHSVDQAPLPGTSRVKVIAIGPYTTYGVRYKGSFLRVPQWVVLDDGRALSFNRMFKGDGTAEVEQGEFIFPGGVVYHPTRKTPIMESAERESRTALYAAKAGILAADHLPVLN